MKFSVFFFTIIISIINCGASKGWNAVGYKDENFYSMGWGGYLKRLFLVLCMLSGVILYYMPNSRYYFRRGCHAIIDLVADSLKAALNVTDDEYTTDDSSSIYSEQETEMTLEKKFISKNSMTSGFNDNEITVINRKCPGNGSKIVKSKDHFYPYHDRDNIRCFNKFSTNENSISFPFETIQLYPKNFTKEFRPSTYSSTNDNLISSGAICLSLNKNKNVYSEKVASRDQKEFLIVEDSEATNYPDETIYGLTGSEPEGVDNSYQCEEKKFENIKTRKRLERQLVEFDMTLRNLRTKFLRKYSTKAVNAEEYAGLLIEAILQSVKNNFGENEESQKNMAKKYNRKSKNIRNNSLKNRRVDEKVISSEHKNRKLTSKISKTENNPDYRSNLPSKRNIRLAENISSVPLSRKRYNGVPLVPEEFVDVPIITNRVKPMLDRAFRWIYGSCPGMETPTVSNADKNFLDDKTRFKLIRSSER